MWILNTIAATLLLSLSTIFLKCKTKRTDASVVTALRTLIVAIFMWIALLTDDKVSSLSSVSGDDWLYLLLTALAMTIGLICYHISLKNGSATGVTALSRSVQLIIMILLIAIFDCTSLLYLRIICIILIAAGIMLAITKKQRSGGQWILFGLLASIAVSTAFIFNSSIQQQALTSVLTVTAILLFSLTAVFIKCLQHGIGKIPLNEFIFIIISGVCSGGAWLFYQFANSDASTTNLTAIISMSLITTAVLSAMLTREKISWKTVCGILLITTGTLLYTLLI